MKISFKNLKFGKSFLSISLDNGKSFKNVNVADVEKSGFLLSDDQDLSAVKIKGPSGLLKSLDVVSNVKIQDNDEIVFTYLKNVDEFDYVEVPESGFILDSIYNTKTTAKTQIHISDDEGNDYYVHNSLYRNSTSNYNELKTHYKELMGKDNLKLELVYRNEITDESGNVTYEEKNRVSLRNKIVIKEYEAKNLADFYLIVRRSTIFNCRPISANLESYTLEEPYGEHIVIPPSLKTLTITIKSSLVNISNNRDINLYYFGSLSDYNNNLIVKIARLDSGTLTKKYPNIYLYDKYHNKRQLL